MGIFLGIDLGTVTIKIALISDSLSDHILRDVSNQVHIFQPPPQKTKFRTKTGITNLLVTKCFPLKGDPVQATYQLITTLLNFIPPDQIIGMRSCGSGGKLIADIIGINCENEFRALANGVAALYPNVSTVFEMGGQNSKYLGLEKHPETGIIGIADYEKS